MNRLYTQFRYGLEKKVVDLYLKAAIGASGAPTINVAGSKGIASIARNSAGKYTVTLQDQYVSLLNMHATIILASGSPAVATVAVRADNSAATAKTVVFEFLDASFAAADIASGATLLVKFELKASTV